MFDVIYKSIQEVLDSDLSSTEIGRQSGVTRQSIDNYRKGTQQIENMTLKIAEKIINLKERNKMKELLNNLLKRGHGIYATSDNITDEKIVEDNYSVDIDRVVRIEYLGQYDGENFELEDNTEIIDGDAVYVIYLLPEEGLSIDNLAHTYWDETNGSYSLEFQTENNTYIVDNVLADEAKTDEAYWDVAENVEKALSEVADGDIKVQE